MSLTPRELEVLREAARWSPKAAAWRLHIAYLTLKNHLASIRIKLGARTMTEAVLTAIGRGDLTCEDVLG
jgi:DNA-binding CsgD family transcriptional regulator